MTKCVFCTRADQPNALFETSSLYAMPDKFPLLAGHVLIISQAHLSCYGAASEDLHGELEGAAERVRGFLRAMYRQPLFVFENGIAGQSVAHAHLHFLPVPTGDLPSEVITHPDVEPVRGWQDIKRHFKRHGSYRYVSLGGHRLIIAGHSPVLALLRGWMADATGLTFDVRGEWIKTTSADDVREVAHRWDRWRAG